MSGRGADGDLALRVLYIHHAGAFGGASRSLLEMIEGFAPGSVTPRLVTQRGAVAAVFRARGVEVIETAGISRLDHTSFSHYRGRRWLLVLREIAYLPATLLAIARARSRWTPIDAVHVNEIVALPAILFARWLLGCPVVVHVRSVQQARQDGWRSRIVRRVLQRHAAAVIAIDETVRRSLPDDVAVEVVHNAYTPKPAKALTTGAAPLLPPRQAGILRVAMVGNPLAFKGVREFVEAARLCRERGLRVEFVLAGVSAEGRTGPLQRMLRAAGLLHDAAEELRASIAQHGLEATVRLLGFTQDIDQVYASVDVLCFPSYLDAVGRPVFEAAFWKVPSIVAVRDPQPDTMIDRETGLCIAPGDPRAIADAVAHFCASPGEAARMGEAAHRLALANFDAARNSARVLEIYRRVLAAVKTTA